jgi:leucyl/phenylalanyl-tRNA--protein transferase
VAGARLSHVQVKANRLQLAAGAGGGYPRTMQDLSPELLLCAYASGVFPMANDRHDPTIHWIEPKHRGILPLDRVHVSRSLRKVIRRGRFEIRVDSAFCQVIAACAESRPERPRTWLNDELLELYGALHAMGYAHSLETWADGCLVGGIYGVSLGAAFFGESMFSRQRDASKVALVELAARLRAGGYQLMDTQFVTDHLRRFGAIEIPRATYRALLRDALDTSATFYGDTGGVASLTPWSSAAGSIGSSQSTTQTS